MYDDSNEKRSNILREMVRVAEALERPLTPEQKARGWKKYNELEAQLNQINAQEKAQKQAEAAQVSKYPENIQKSMDKIRQTLAEAKKKERARHG